MAFLDMPADVKSELKPALAGCEVVEDGRGGLDFAMVFVKSQAELKKQFVRVAKRLAPAGMLWVGWPKKSSGVSTDLDENIVAQDRSGGRTGGRKGVRRDRDLVRIEVCDPRERPKNLSGVAGETPALPLHNG
ncbi:MAG TPA: hypothetical protein VMT28_05700 [Terriglobales bacterium]|nr:hypothetical protein [Terriglobales bacterium]